MHEPSPEDVIAQAHRTLDERRAMTAACRDVHERPWWAFFVGIAGALVLVALIAPGFSLEQKLYLLLHGVCAQEHNIILGELQLPLCTRDSGLYISAVITITVLWWRGRSQAGGFPSRPLAATLVLLVVVMAVDGLNSTLAQMHRPSLYVPRNDLRLITGMGMGVTIGALLLLMLNRAFRRDVREDLPVLGQWRELGLIVAIDGLVVAAILGQVGVAAWPLALLAFIGVTGTLFVAFLVVLGTLLRYDGAVTGLRQLARPATFALLLSVAFLVALARLRLTAEAQGILPPLQLP